MVYLVQILDDDPTQLNNRKTKCRRKELHKKKMKQLFMQQPSANQASVKHDHDYVNSSDFAIPPQEASAGWTNVQCKCAAQKLIDELYSHHVRTHQCCCNMGNRVIYTRTTSVRQMTPRMQISCDCF